MKFYVLAVALALLGQVNEVRSDSLLVKHVWSAECARGRLKFSEHEALAVYSGSKLWIVDTVQGCRILADVGFDIGTLCWLSDTTIVVSDFREGRRRKPSNLMLIDVVTGGVIPAPHRHLEDLLPDSLLTYIGPYRSVEGNVYYWVAGSGFRRICFPGMADRVNEWPRLESENHRLIWSDKTRDGTLFLSNLAGTDSEAIMEARYPGYGRTTESNRSMTHIVTPRIGIFDLEDSAYVDYTSHLPPLPDTAAGWEVALTLNPYYQEVIMQLTVAGYVGGDPHGREFYVDRGLWLYDLETHNISPLDSVIGAMTIMPAYSSDGKNIASWRDDTLFIVYRDEN